VLQVVFFGMLVKFAHTCWRVEDRTAAQHAIIGARRGLSYDDRGRRLARIVASMFRPLTTTYPASLASQVTEVNKSWLSASLSRHSGSR
jgi:hypothetical protein